MGSNFYTAYGNKVHLTASANRDKSNSFWHEHSDNDPKSPLGAKIHLEEYFKNQPNSAFIVPYGPEKYMKWKISQLNNN